ncbi:hypothetical protein CEXT_18991 [Caerostris extrusa]|uniref:Uncharacterized protein n=1 Tax=Caerostris extrusa TaxID=172846 RepID=A0AAV4QCL8_CAEEX|nr:hypothetical protein CEXT_18991 [Caerostris extrusa]
MRICWRRSYPKWQASNFVKGLGPRKVSGLNGEKGSLWDDISLYAARTIYPFFYLHEIYPFFFSACMSCSASFYHACVELVLPKKILAKMGIDFRNFLFATVYEDGEWKFAKGEKLFFDNK